MILERILLAILISGSIWMLIWLWSRFSIYRRIRRGLGLESFVLGRPAILYFTSPDCLPCKTIQEPELDRVLALYGDHIQIIRINVLEQPKLADDWGVLSIPTTFIIDPEGRPRGVNHGVAKGPKLLDQVKSVSAFLPKPIESGRSVPGSQGYKG